MTTASSAIFRQQSHETRSQMQTLGIPSFPDSGRRAYAHYIGAKRVGCVRTRFVFRLSAQNAGLGKKAEGPGPPPMHARTSTLAPAQACPQATTRVRQLTNEPRAQHARCAQRAQEQGVGHQKGAAIMLLYGHAGTWAAAHSQQRLHAQILALVASQTERGGDEGK
jgi:hypothetical protein